MQNDGNQIASSIVSELERAWNSADGTDGSASG